MVQINYSSELKDSMQELLYSWGLFQKVLGSYEPTQEKQDRIPKLMPCINYFNHCSNAMSSSIHKEFTAVYFFSC